MIILVSAAEEPKVKTDLLQVICQGQSLSPPSYSIFSSILAMALNQTLKIEGLGLKALVAQPPFWAFCGDIWPAKERGSYGLGNIHLSKEMCFFPGQICVTWMYALSGPCLLVLVFHSPVCFSQELGAGTQTLNAFSSPPQLIALLLLCRV